MLVYNPKFFNSVSPKFLKRVNTTLTRLNENNIKLSFASVHDLGAGKIPMRLFASEYCDDLVELHNTLLRWSAQSKDKACVRIGKVKGAEPVFIEID